LPFGAFSPLCSQPQNILQQHFIPENLTLLFISILDCNNFLKGAINLIKMKREQTKGVPENPTNKRVR
jgi:putative component of membrane protein insertase Oxa1/YidC/SpoIIIJ protein YidD